MVKGDASIVGVTEHPIDRMSSACESINSGAGGFECVIALSNIYIIWNQVAVVGPFNGVDCGNCRQWYTMDLADEAGAVDLLDEIVSKCVRITWITIEDQFATVYGTIPIGEDVPIYMTIVVGVWCYDSDVVIVEGVVDDMSVGSTPDRNAASSL